MRITTKKIIALKPCEDRLVNWMNYYPKFNGSLEKFLFLPNITHQDKIWVAVRLLPRELIEIFAIDCVFRATAAADAYAAADAAYAAADAAADAAAYAADAAYAAYAADAAADAAYAAADAAADAAAYAADAAYAAYARQKEQEFQIESLLYLTRHL